MPRNPSSPRSAETPVETLSATRVRAVLRQAAQRQILVAGDVMLDQFIWGQVRRISPEAPVPVVEFGGESLMPGGAANVARNLTALGAATEVFGVIGADDAGRQLKRLLAGNRVGCTGLSVAGSRRTSVKTRIIANQQQVVRLDRETHSALRGQTSRALLAAVDRRLDRADAVILGDYGKGVVTQWLLDEIKARCRERGIWLSLDPKPTRRLNLEGLSLITPNRKEAFELAGMHDGHKSVAPARDPGLLQVADALLARFHPALLLITLGELGMLLCRRNQAPFHIPTVAREVFDVSGAGDTVIASFTLAIAAGASPIEAAVLSNHAAGVVVGKVGTATVSPEEVISSFQGSQG